MSILDSLHDSARSGRGEIVELAKSLIRARTENPPGDEDRAARVVCDYLSARDIPFELHAKEPGRTNVLASVGSGHPILLTACHLDTVPAGEGWHSDPFEPLERDGRVIGRGACDNKGPMAATLAVLSFLKRHEANFRGKGTFVVACVADEERGSCLGMEYLLAEKLLHADCAVIPDCPDHMNSIVVSEKGALFVEITSHGVQAHGSTPHHGVNAIWNLFELLEQLRNTPLAPFVHPLHTPPTMNLGMLHGGSAPNMVPAKAVASVDFRYLPGQTQEDVLNVIRGRMDQLQQRTSGAFFDLRVLTELKPSEVTADIPLVRMLQEQTKRIAGFVPKATGLSGATVNKQLIEHGIDAVGFCPGDNKVPHTADEYINVEELMVFAEILGSVFVELS